MPRTTVRGIRSSRSRRTRPYGWYSDAHGRDSRLGEAQTLLCGDGEPVTDEAGHGAVELLAIRPDGCELGRRHGTVRGAELPHDEPAHLTVGPLETGLDRLPRALVGGVPRRTPRAVGGDRAFLAARR